jgi:four helix bundle protein
MASGVQLCSGVASHFTELDAWQLAVKLREHVARLIAQPAMRRERSLCDDLGRAAASVPNNIAEGFGRFRPKDFRRFMEIARASLCEVQNRLLEAQSRGLITRDEFSVVWQLSRRTAAAIAGLMRYLLTEEAQQAAARFARPNREKSEKGP